MCVDEVRPVQTLSRGTLNDDEELAFTCRNYCSQEYEWNFLLAYVWHMQHNHVIFCVAWLYYSVCGSTWIVSYWKHWSRSRQHWYEKHTALPTQHVTSSAVAVLDRPFMSPRLRNKISLPYTAIILGTLAFQRKEKVLYNAIQNLQSSQEYFCPDTNSQTRPFTCAVIIALNCWFTSLSQMILILDRDIKRAGFWKSVLSLD